MFDVREQQLLMLLLVMKAHLEPLRKLVTQAAVQLREHGRVDSRSVGRHFVVTRSSQKAARCTIILFTNAVVVAVVEHGVRILGQSLDTSGL